MRRAFLLMVLLGLCVPACLDDLPAPDECPAPALRDATSCFDSTATDFGCLPEEQRACLTDRPDCQCAADECPRSRHACFPDGDCPPPVSRRAPNATCRRLDARTSAPLVESVATCECGCMACIDVCDGVGPVIGVNNDGVFDVSDLAVPAIEVGSLLPASGRLGLYIRARGLVNFAMVLVRGDINDPASIEQLDGFSVFQPAGDQFVDDVLYDQSLVGTSAFEWAHDDAKPTYVVIIPGFGDEASTTLFELDCIVPFFEPLG